MEVLTGICQPPGHGWDGGVVALSTRDSEVVAIRQGRRDFMKRLGARRMMQSSRR